MRLNQGGTLRAPIIATGLNASAGLDTYATGGSPPAAFKYLSKLPVMDADGDGKPDILIPSTTQGFALKMCTIQHVIKLTADTLHCPVIGSTPPATPANANATDANPPICAAYACPPDPGTDTVNLPANPVTADAGPHNYPYEWKDETGTWQPAFNLFDSSPAHSGSFAGSDNSTYHLAMLKFVQTDANTITVSAPIETPIVARLGSGQTGTEDLFGDGLPDVIGSIGCAPNPQTFPGVQNPAVNFTLNNCQVVGDGTYGPAHLFDGAGGTQGTATTGFNVNPVLYASVNQGSLVQGGSLTLAAPARPTPTLPALVSAASAGVKLQPNPTLPGLVFKTVNGLADEAIWQLAPLSNPLIQGDVPFYTITGSSYLDPRHYFFTSSMPAVAGFYQSDGIAGAANIFGFRGAVYGYADAIYNHLGRGFQGFRAITAETTQDSVPDLARMKRTKTTFNQKFPLAGKVASVEVRVPQATLPIGGETVETLIERETDTWTCASDRSLCPSAAAANTVYTPLLDNQSVAEFDITSAAQYSQVDTVNANGTTWGWDSYGNLTNQTVTRKDIGQAVQNYVLSHVTTTTNSYAAADTTTWWVNKMLTGTVTSSINYTTNHTLPTASTTPSVMTSYTWNTDRTPATKTQSSAPAVANQRMTTSYCYPQAAATTAPACPKTTTATSYGLPTQVQVCLGTLSTTSGVTSCTADAVSSPTRTTSFTYTKGGTGVDADGYFVFTTKNGLNQTTTAQHQTSDGQVTLVTDPNGVKTQTSYDVFGRPTQIDYLNSASTNYASSTVMALNSCSAALCDGNGVGEDGVGEDNAVYRLTTSRTGYPTQVTWYDVLGRTVKHAERGFDGTMIETTSEYDHYNTVVMQSQPFFSGLTTYLTGYSYDRLNRPTQKIGQGAEMDTRGNTVTDYVYDGRNTNITVCTTSMLPAQPAKQVCPATAPNNAANLYLKMSRSKNVLGQWMQTTDAIAGITNYWTEPQGHVVAMKDAESNLASATYNSLGQRTNSYDPDQGAWSFSYDALGELISQTDARGVLTSVTGRDVLGRMTQQTQTLPTGGLPTGLTNQTLLDQWSYDPSNGIGELDTTTRWRNSSSTLPNPVTDTAVWKEQTTYDTAARPSTITTTINDGSALSLGSAMSYDSDGRALTHTYPSGLVVKNLYSAYGQLQSMTNNGSTAYWTATAENEWGHVTSELLPGSLTGTHQDYDSTGQSYRLSWSGSATSDLFTYNYDPLANLVSQQRTASASNNTESYAYDSLQRLSTATRATGGNAVNYAYTASGNLKYKDDYSIHTASAYSYGTSVGSTTGACGPHGAMSVALPGTQTATYSCDSNGNVIGGTTLSASYDADNHPTTITRTFISVPIETCRKGDTVFCDGFETLALTSGGTGSSQWAYDTQGQRYYEHTSQGNRYFAPGGYELIGGVHKHEIGPVVVSRSGSTDSITVLLKDRMGSTLDTIDGSTVARRTYDAFGAVRNGNMSNRANGTLNLTPDTIHGFTNHTHEDDVALIHMGGRVYDYTLGRFLNVDPVIGNPMSSQSLNPYSYVLNNPLAGKDPTGYDCEVPTGSHICGANTAATSIQVAGTSATQDKAAAAAAVANAGGNGHVTSSTQVQGSADTKGSDVQSLNANSTTTAVATPTKNTPEATTIPTTRFPEITVRPMAEPLEAPPSFLGNILELGLTWGAKAGVATALMTYSPYAGDHCECGACGGVNICAAPPLINNPGFGDASGLRNHTSMNSESASEKKITKPGVTGKEGAKDVPSWAKGERPNVGESGKNFADRLLDDKYGRGNYKKGGGSEWSQIQKWGDRSFVDPK